MTADLDLAQLYIMVSFEIYDDIYSEFIAFTCLSELNRSVALDVGTFINCLETTS